MSSAPRKPISMLYAVIVFCSVLFILIPFIFIIMINQEQIHVDKNFVNWAYGILALFILTSIVTLVSATHEFSLVNQDPEQ